MSAFNMQVACKCVGLPVGMECIEMWDGDSTPHLVKGRRYVWECPNCKHQVCINMALVGEEE